MGEKLRTLGDYPCGFMAKNLAAEMSVRRQVRIDGGTHHRLFDDELTDAPMDKIMNLGKVEIADRGVIVRRDLRRNRRCLYSMG